MWGYVFAYMVGVVTGIVATAFLIANREARRREERMPDAWLEEARRLERGDGS